MASVRLTDRSVASAKAPPGRRLELFDAMAPGLILRVSDTGRKTWVCRYRTADGSRQPRLTLGTYPGLLLTDARTRALEVAAEARKGGDPSMDQKQARHAAQSRQLRTFNDLANAYFEACTTGEWRARGKQKKARTMASEQNTLKLHVRPALGDLPLEQITRSMVRNVLRKLVVAGKGTTANRTQAIVRQCFAFAISEELLEVNPAQGFAPLSAEAPRARILADAELKSLWCGLRDPSSLSVDGRPARLSRPMAIALQLAILLLQRRGEIAGMRIDELDLERGTWLLPSARTKNGRPHLVPLPPASVQLIRDAIALRRGPDSSDGERPSSPFVFPAWRGTASSIRADSLTHALAEVYAALRIQGATVHDLRRTGATAMTSERLGISPFIRSKVLNHLSDAGGGAAVSARVYDANAYVSEKRAALAAWEALLLEIVGERHRADNVTSLHEGARAKA